MTIFLSNIKLGGGGGLRRGGFTFKPLYGENMEGVLMALPLSKAPPFTDPGREKVVKTREKRLKTV